MAEAATAMQRDLFPALDAALDQALSVEAERRIAGLSVEELRALILQMRPGHFLFSAHDVIKHAMVAAVRAAPLPGEDVPNEWGVYRDAAVALCLATADVRVSVRVARNRWGWVAGHRISIANVTLGPLGSCVPVDIFEIAFPTQAEAIHAELATIARWFAEAEPEGRSARRAVATARSWLAEQTRAFPFTTETTSA